MASNFPKQQHWDLKDNKWSLENSKWKVISNLESFTPPKTEHESKIKTMWTQSLNKKTHLLCAFLKNLETILSMQKSKQYEWIGICSTCSFNNQLIHCLLLDILKMYRSPYQKRKGLAFRKQGESNMQEKGIPGWWCCSR